MTPPTCKTVSVGGGVFFVDEYSGDAPRAAAEVFVGAPCRLLCVSSCPFSLGEGTYEIDAPFMEVEDDIPYAMCKVPACDNALTLGVFGDCFDVKCLSGVVLDTGEE